MQTAILQDLCQTLGVEATLPETAVKDLVLQVVYFRVYPFLQYQYILLKFHFHYFHFKITEMVNCRESDEFKLVVSCRKLLPNISMKASIASILLVPEQIHNNSLICWRACLGKLMKMTWTLNNWRARKQQPSITRQHELRSPQYLRNMEPSLRIKLLVSSCGPHQFP